MTSFSSSGTIGPTPTKAETRLSKTQESMRGNKHPIGKQRTNNQLEEYISNKGGKGEKEEETGREKRVH